MARRGTREYTATIDDKLTGSEIALYYTLPTSEDRLAFETNFLKREGNEINSELINAQIDLGIDKLTGFRFGDFEREIDGEWKPFSSDPNSPDYYEDWRGWIREFACDLMEEFVLHIFRRGRSAVVSNVREYEPGK